jgi:Rieske 2Fe-2S family protein
MDRVFHRQWVFAGHVARVKEPGDFFLFNLGGEELIITRATGSDGQIHALFNVCRHRGSRVCLEAQGHAKALVCPYHAWTYAANGSLIGARAMPDDFDKTKFGLKKCHVRVVEGLIFVCLSDTPPDASESFELIERFFRPHGLADLKVAARMVWTVKANWKLVVENFGECYHCVHTHPEYCRAMAHAIPDANFNPKLRADFDQQVAAWEVKAKSLGHFTGAVKAEGDALRACGRMPVGYGHLTQTLDGKPAAPLMGSFKEYDGGYTYAGLRPMTYILALNDFVVLPRFTPLTEAKTEVVFYWLVREDAVEGKDYDVEHLVHVYKVTTEQDKKIVEDNQAGVNSAAYEPGPYSLAEQGLVRFNQWYMKQLA